MIPAAVVPVKLPPVLVVRVTVKMAPPASTSAKVTDDKSTGLLTSSVTVMSVGRVPVGSSLTGVTVMSIVSVSERFVPPPRIVN